MKKLVEKVKKKLKSSNSSKNEITKRSQLQEVPPAPPGVTIQAPSQSAPSPKKKEIPIPENMMPEEQIKVETVEKLEEPEQPEQLEQSLELPDSKIISHNPVCPHCNKELKEDFDFCPYCGKSVKLTCSNCNKELKEDFDFCPYCGHEIQKSK